MKTESLPSTDSNFSIPLTAIGAVSPPGGDISEPVSQATMRIVKVFWGLDASLAYARHFPAINWLTSYSLYLDTLKGWCDENLGRSFMQNRGRAMALLQKEAELQEIVKLVGQDALSPADNLTLESAKMIREDFLVFRMMKPTMITGTTVMRKPMPTHIKPSGRTTVSKNWTPPTIKYNWMLLKQNTSK